MEPPRLTRSDMVWMLAFASLASVVAIVYAFALVSPAHAATASPLPVGPSWDVLRPAIPLLAGAFIAMVAGACSRLLADPATRELSDGGRALVELLRALLVLLAASIPELAGLGQGETAAVIAQGLVVWLVSHGYVPGGRAAVQSVRAARRP